MHNNRTMQPPGSNPQICIALADASDRELIYAARHAVYGFELGQHPPNSCGQLRDALDEFNVYIVAKRGADLLAFVSVTPPGPHYSVDKYFDRSCVPVNFDSGLFEVRLLTVLAEARGTLLAAAMMYAALRYAEEHGGQQIVAIGRREVLDLYLSVGLRSAQLQAQAGQVIYELLAGYVADVRSRLHELAGVLARIENQCDWQLPFPFSPSETCSHGGAFWNDVGDDFHALEKLNQIVSADVLDAWFPPAPQVISALEENLAVLVQTSPPADAQGLISAIARARNVPTECVLPAAGSSELIFRAFPAWLEQQSRVLVLDPSYGEYVHLFENVIKCKVDRLRLRRQENYRLLPDELKERLSRGYDLVALVNPNSPTGMRIASEELCTALADAPAHTRIWVDETYIDYAGAEHSLERFAAATQNVFVCKSMSKAYALSGLRVAYLVGNPSAAQNLRRLTPPWSVSLPAQVAAVAALGAKEYYRARYEETARFRCGLAAALTTQLGFDVVPGAANFLLCHLPDHAPTAKEICARTKTTGVYLRDAGTISPSLGERALRIAVKDQSGNERIVAALRDAIGRCIAESTKNGG